MDSIAKFIGYVVLVVAALALWGRYSDGESAPAAEQKVAVVDPCRKLETAQMVNHIAAELLRKTQDFGNDIAPTITSCKYFAAEDTMLLSVRICSTGPFSGDFYEKSGLITIDSRRWRREETGANGNLQAFRFLTGVVQTLGSNAQI